MTHSIGKLKGPLAGLRIIEMAALGPVPFSGMMLADLGAEVIRIERAGAAPMGEPIDAQFDLMGRGRRSISLDLKTQQGIDIVIKLATTADVMMEGMRPGAMERLGLGPAECLAANSRLIYARMTGWGQTGPLAQKAGHDINYISLNGVLHSIGEKAGSPVPPVNYLGDYGGGSMFLMVGILAALFETRSSGQGQVIDAAMLEGSSYLASTVHMFKSAGLWRPERGTNFLDGGAPFYRVYETADGKHVAVGAIEPKFYGELLAGLDLDPQGLPQPQDPRHWEELQNVFTDVFRTRTRDEWAEIFLHRDACVTPVLSFEESIEHEHNRVRNNFLNVSGSMRPNATPRFTRTTTDAGSPTPSAGEHGDEILRELEFTEREIEELVRQQIVVLSRPGPS